MIIPYHENLEKKLTPIGLRGKMHSMGVDQLHYETEISSFILPNGKLVQEGDAHQESEFMLFFARTFINFMKNFFYEDEKTVVINDITTPPPRVNPFSAAPEDLKKEEEENDILQLSRTNDDMILGLTNIRECFNNKKTNNALVTRNNIETCNKEIKRLKEERELIEVGDLKWLKDPYDLSNNPMFQQFKKEENICSKIAGTPIKKRPDGSRYTFDDLVEIEKSKDPFFKHYKKINLIENAVAYHYISKKSDFAQKLPELIQDITFNNIYSRIDV